MAGPIMAVHIAGTGMDITEAITVVRSTLASATLTTTVATILIIQPIMATTLMATPTIRTTTGMLTTARPMPRLTRHHRPKPAALVRMIRTAVGCPIPTAHHPRNNTNRKTSINSSNTTIRACSIAARLQVENHGH